MCVCTRVCTSETYSKLPAPSFSIYRLCVEFFVQKVFDDGNRIPILNYKILQKSWFEKDAFHAINFGSRCMCVNTYIYIYISYAYTCASHAFCRISCSI